MNGENMESPQPNKSPKEAALGEIGALRQEVYLMGANDSEIPEIDIIMAQLRNDERTPEEALAAAFAIRNSKQEYH